VDKQTGTTTATKILVDNRYLTWFMPRQGRGSLWKTGEK